MKVALITYMHAVNGIELQLTHDTDIEKALLRGFGKHGHVEYSDEKLRIVWKFTEEVKP